MEIPIPKGLELPEVPAGETIQLTVTFAVEEGMLEIVEIEGIPVEEMEETEQPEAPAGNEDFVSAVNRQLP